MELLKNLFEGYPNLWGGGVAHSVLILSLVIAFGIMLGKIKISASHLVSHGFFLSVSYSAISI